MNSPAGNSEWLSTGERAKESGKKEGEGIAMFVNNILDTLSSNSAQKTLSS